MWADVSKIGLQFDSEKLIFRIQRRELRMNYKNSDEPPSVRTTSIRADNVDRFSRVSKDFAEAIARNRPVELRGSGCPVLVEGKRDASALREFGFSGEIEILNRGWDQSRIIAYLYENYGTRNTVDQGPSVILLMDWDRTGGRLQSRLRKRLNALDMKVDESLWHSLVKNMKPEGRTVESLHSHAGALNPMIRDHLFPLGNRTDI